MKLRKISRKIQYNSFLSVYLPFGMGKRKQGKEK